MARTLSAARRLPLPAGFNPLRVIELAAGFRDSVPDIMEFCISDKYLNRPYIYPRQATLLKIIFLQDELFTQYDFDVIGEWTQSYEMTADDQGIGNNGIQPDILERIALCQAEGRPWFREVLNVSGRRGSKGHIGAYAGSYVLWNYLAWGDPQGHFGVDRDKKMVALVFAGKKEQARANQWKDLTNVILGGPCFAPYISRSLGEMLSVYAPHDFLRMYERWERGIFTEDDLATFEILPKESTIMAARGPASFMQHYDEFAHVVATGANRSAEEVWDSATPSLDQFKDWAFIYQPSSPWQKTGQFYTNYLRSLERDEETNEIVYPEVAMVQLTSWDIYKDWEIANDLRTEPGGMRLMPLKGAIQEYDSQMQRLERANPDTFRVERRSQFATVLDAYLNEEKVKGMWAPYEGRVLEQQTQGRLNVVYRAHGDPSKSGAGFGYAIAHIDRYDDNGLPHVVFDKIHSWNPADFPNNEIDYLAIEQDLQKDLDAFMPSELTFDQFNSVATIQSLRRYVAKKARAKQTVVYERTATGPLNWKTYETFKTALYMGLIHGPYHELADLELRFLQDLGGKVEHPTSGPVQTKDIADAIAIVVYELIGEQMSAFLGKSLGELPLAASVRGGMDPHQAQQAAEVASQLSGFGRARGRSMPGQRRRR